MKLKTFETENPRNWNIKTDTRTMSANRKGGFFSFNTKTIQDFNLKLGDRVVVAQDEDSRNDWYVRFVEAGNETGSKLRVNRENKGKRIYGMRTNNLAASTAILDSVRATYSATFIIATTPTKMADGTIWYRVLTANPIMTR